MFINNGLTRPGSPIPFYMAKVKGSRMTFYTGRTLLFVMTFVFLSCLNERTAHVKETMTSTESPHVSNNSAIAVIYLSADGGSTWRPYANGIPTDATVIAFHVNDKSIYAIADNNKIYSTKEGLSNWLETATDLPDNIDINDITSIGDIFMIGTTTDGVFVSKNCSNWQKPSSFVFNTPIRCLIAIHNTLLAGTDTGIYKSTDYGMTWNQVYKGGQVNGFTELNNKIYAALVNGAAITLDTGSNWRYIYQPRTLHDISNDGESIYAMTLGAGLLKSKNDGLTWENINHGLGTYNLYTFELKQINDRVFAAQWYGIYLSNDGGKNWAIIKNGLPDSTAFTTLETFGTNLIAGIGLRTKSEK